MFGIVVTYPTTLTTWFDEDGDVVVIKPDEVAAYTIDPVAVVYEELTAYPLTNTPFAVGDVPVAIPNIPVLLPVELAFASDHVLDELRKYNCPVVNVPDPNLTISPLNAGDVGGANINEPLRVCVPVNVPDPDTIKDPVICTSEPDVKIRFDLAGALVPFPIINAPCADEDMLYCPWTCW